MLRFSQVLSWAALSFHFELQSSLLAVSTGFEDECQHMEKHGVFDIFE